MTIEWKKEIRHIVNYLKGQLSADIFEDAIRAKFRLCVGNQNADPAHYHVGVRGTDGGIIIVQPISNKKVTGTFDKTQTVEIAHGLGDLDRINSVSVFVKL